MENRQLYHAPARWRVGKAAGSRKKSELLHMRHKV